jgi:hypothetical protein
MVQYLHILLKLLAKYSTMEFCTCQWTILQLTKIFISTSLDKIHSMKEHHKISNIPKFRCEML